MCEVLNCVQDYLGFNVDHTGKQSSSQMMQPIKIPRSNHSALGRISYHLSPYLLSPHLFRIWENIAPSQCQWKRPLTWARHQQTRCVVRLLCCFCLVIWRVLERLAIILVGSGNLGNYEDHFLKFYFGSS